MTDVPPPDGDPAEQPVVAMELLDDQPAPPAPRALPAPAQRMWAWAAVTLAAAGVGEVIGSLQWLVTARISDPDGGYMEMDVGAAAYRIQSNVAPSYTSIDPPHWGVALQSCGVLAVLIALGLVARQRGRLRRAARPLTTLGAGLVLGSLAMLAMYAWDSTLVRNSASHVTTSLEAGAWLSVAAAVAAITTIVLVLRIDDGPPPDPGEPADAVADLDTPPLGIPLPSADLN